MFTDKGYALVYLFLIYIVRVAKYYTTCVLNLIIEKLTEVLHIHFALVCVNNSRKSAKYRPVGVCILHRLDDVGKLTHARGLDKYSVGMVIAYYFFKSFGKVANKRATNTSRVHLVYLHPCLSKKSAVNAYLAKLIFDKHKLFALVGFLNKLFYKCRFTCSEKPRKNINFSHFICLSVAIQNYFVPVEPNPPSPRAVESSSSACTNSAV